MAARKVRKKTKKTRRNWLIPTLAAGAFVALTAGGLAIGHVWSRTAPDDRPEIEVDIPKGASLHRAAAELAEAKVIDHPVLFRILAQTFGSDKAIQYGLYGIRAGEGYGRILGRMQRGDTLVVRVTIPEGMPSIMVAERLNKIERLRGVAPIPEEGSILPATYDVKMGEERAAIIKRMQDAMDDEFDRLWKNRKPASVVKNRHEAMTLASIVEKESGVAIERRRIAGLYSNRLRINMPLQADPTVIYPITKGKPLGRRILRSELQADNGYNTYRQSGLPKGPITNPGREALAAVLDPEMHDYLYMVADGTGGHAFAHSYAEHQANVAKWRAHRKEKGI